MPDWTVNDKNLNGMLARLVANDVADVADMVADAARLEAGKHSRTGEFEKSIHMERGKTDSYVVADDPEALHIEMGHLSRDRKRWVKGLHILRNAAITFGGGRGRIRD